MNIIGREKECQLLKSMYGSDEAEFLAVHGRRRVGKTFLIREYFRGKGLFFEVVGIKNGSIDMQLHNFIGAMTGVFENNQVSLQASKNWHDAFKELTRLLKLQDPNQKIILFFDELPWMATKKSQFLQWLDHYWNAHWSQLPNLLLIVCGSAASWMLKKIVQAKGGLYNRLTGVLSLKPFSLFETNEYLQSRGVRLNQKQVLDIYMVMGGIPHYLKQIKKGKSAVQIVTDLCFSEDGLLYDEFSIVFESLFDNFEEHCKIIRAIAITNSGRSREQILSDSGLSSGGTFHRRMQELIASGFVKSFRPYGKKTEKYFKIIDEYTLFYLKQIEPFKQQSDEMLIADYWAQKSSSSQWRATAGFLFEMICLKHSVQIYRALGLEKLICGAGTWRFVPKKGSTEAGSQIDLLFERTDGAFTIVEIKYSQNLYAIDKAYGQQLLKKLDVFAKKLKTDKQLFIAMVTTKGVKKNLWSEELVSGQVVLGDLFKL